MAGVPAAWFPDPTGRNEQRYWDGTVWTNHVARGGVQSTDVIAGDTRHRCAARPSRQ